MPGRYQFVWYPNVPAGVYFVYLKIDDKHQTKKVIFIKR